MRSFKTALTVIGAITVLLLAGNTVAYAATGGKFFLGKTNFANKQSTLVRTTSGPALKLATKYASNPPLATNGRGRVANLNADMVDGLDSSTLRNHSYVFTKSVGVATGLFSVSVPVPAGTYELSYSAFLQGAASGWAYCQIIRTHNSLDTYVAIEQIQAPIFTPGLSGAGVVVKSAGDTLVFECGAENNFTTQAAVPIQLVMTPTVVTSNGALRVAPHSSSRVAGR
jgi:hypothetical protein